MHHQTLLDIEANAAYLQNNFSKTITGISLNKLEISYQNRENDTPIIQELKEIINFSVPKIGEQIKEGKQIYDFLETQIQISPVGIVPLNFKEGYFLLEQSNQKVLHVFQYKMSLLKKGINKWYRLNSSYITCFNQSIQNSIESIKKQIITQNQDLPNPATFVVTSKLQIPFTATYLPLAKRMLEEHISKEETQNNYIN
jgi:hypothetical protein